jgi:hypothetical protein
MRQLASFVLTAHLACGARGGAGASIRCEVVQSSDLSVSCSKLRRQVESCSRKVCAHQSFNALAEFTSQTLFLGAVLCSVDLDATAGSSQRCGCFYAGVGRCFRETGHVMHVFGDSTMRQFAAAVNLVWKG